MTAPPTPTAERITDLAEAAHHGRGATLTHDELAALVSKCARVVEAERLLGVVNKGVLWSKAMDGWHCPRCGVIEGHTDDCIHGRIAAFLSPATATEEPR